MHSLRLALLLAPLTGCIVVSHDPWHRHDRPHDRPHDDDGWPDQGGGGPGGGGGGDEGEPGEWVSDYGSGRYAAVSIEVLPAEVGADLDGDGTPDNNLGAVLDALSDSLSAGGWSARAELQRLVDEGAFVPLLAARQAADEAGQPRLRIAVLSGFEDEAGALVVDPACLDADGAARWALDGQFLSQEELQVGPGEVSWVARHGAEDTVLELRVVDATLSGWLAAEGAELTATGVAPAATLIELLLRPYLGDEGLDLDGDGVAELSTEEALERAWQLAADPGLADIALADGSRGISLALRQVYVPAEF